MHILFVFLNVFFRWVYYNKEEKRVIILEVESAGRKQMHYTYMLRCKDNTYYTGYTNNLEKRLKAHNEGKGAKYTKGRGPVELVYYETFEDKSSALRREWEIKQLSRKEKEAMCGE